MTEEGKGEFKDLGERAQEPQPAQTGGTPPQATIEYCYGNGWRMMWKHSAELLLIWIVNFLLAIPGWIPLLGLFYSAFVSSVIYYGSCYVSLKASRNEIPQVGDLFIAFKTNYWNTLVAIALTGLIIIGGFILLIVPGIFFICKLAFVPYLVTDRKMGATDAIKKSWQMTKGHSMTIFLMLLLAIPIIILGIICVIVGVIPAAIWIGIALASMYKAVDGELKYVAS